MKFAAWFLWFVAIPATQAATIVVTTNDDPFPNGCLPGDCSLREAVQAANATVDADLIQVPAGLFGLPRGQLPITSNVQIYGSADATTNIIGVRGEVPVFDISGTPTVTLAHLSIEAHGADAIDSDNNARTILAFVNILVTDSLIRVNDSSNGSGTLDIRASEIHSPIYCGQAANCRVSDSQIRTLTVGANSNAQNRVVIERSLIDGDLGPGNVNVGVVILTNNTVAITDTTVQHTNLGLMFFGAVPSQITLDRLSYVDNAAPVHISVAAPVTIIDSEFRDNLRTVSTGPGALHVDAASADVTVSGSTFTNNRGNGDTGGAVLVEDGATLQLTNSTFSGNTFSAEAAAAGARGAAIGYRVSPDVTSLFLKNVTVVAPAFVPVGIQGTGLGGFGNGSFLVLNLNDSILRANCGIDAGAIDHAFNNIESAGNTCAFSPAQQNLVSVSSTHLALGSLGNHDGPTPTYLPAASSVAVDSGSSSLQCLDFDQRGYARPYGAACDIGAVEVGAAADPIFANSFE